MFSSRLAGFMTVALLTQCLVHAQTDVQVIGDAVLSPSEISEGASVMYLVRFQNTGQDTAFQIVVRDTLDPRLDVNTFSMVAASHDYELLRDGSNVIRWYFTDVALPDSGSSDPDSYGFVLFTVQPKSFLTPGQVIGNNACITFDQQQNICTNTAYIWIDADADVKEPNALPNFKVVPNPNHGEFEIRSVVSSNTTATPAKPAEWWITDINGKTIWDGKAEDATTVSNQVWMEKPAPGLYLLWVKGNADLKVQQFAVIR